MRLLTGNARLEAGGEVSCCSGKNNRGCAGGRKTREKAILWGGRGKRTCGKVRCLLRRRQRVAKKKDGLLLEKPLAETERIRDRGEEVEGDREAIAFLFKRTGQPE